MCGRFCIAASPGELMERYGVEVPPEYRPRYNIAPAQPVLAIEKTSDRYEARMIEWGFQPEAMHRIINARVETVRQKPLFASLFSRHRCLIPASGYYEWKDEGARRIPYYFLSASEELISFAGLIRPSREGDKVIIMTTQASFPCSVIHDRMPVILKAEHEVKFLEEGIISPAPDVQMVQVSPRVNQITNDDPDLIKPWKENNEQKTLIDLF